MVCNGTTYRIVEWSTGIVLQTYDKLSTAKKACREMGYQETRFSGKAPFAYVQCDMMVHDGWDDKGIPQYKRVTDGCIYNPRFK